MSKIQPTIGRIVLYVLSMEDASSINRRRTDSGHIAQRMRTNSWPAGAMAHIGADVKAGDIFPAIVVKVSPENAVNLSVQLDGSDTFWVTNRHCSDSKAQGMYHWMDYQKAQAAAQEGGGASQAFAALDARINTAEAQIKALMAELTNEQAERVSDKMDLVDRLDLTDKAVSNLHTQEASTQISAVDSIDTRVPVEAGTFTSGESSLTPENQD